MNPVSSVLLLIAFAAALLGCTSGSALAAAGPCPPINAAAQEHIAELLQDALGPYRADAEFSGGSTNQPSRRLLSLEAAFREASALMPDRLDLRFGIASAQILLALQTNSQFDVHVSNALSIYRDIHALDTNGFEAPLLYAAYARASGDERAYAATVHQLSATHPQRTREYLDRFRRVEGILAMPLEAEPNNRLPIDRTHAIVLLGAALDTNGTMRPKLIGRLEQTLKLARVYPEAPVIVTGGNARGGVTEAYVMSLWLKNRGLAAERIHLEDKARDTLGNAFYSAALLEKLKIKHVTLVTSVTHVRRGLADFEEACRQRGLNLAFATLAAAEEQELDLCRERLAVYRDTLRASGLWAFPGVQR